MSTLGGTPTPTPTPSPAEGKGVKDYGNWNSTMTYNVDWGHGDPIYPMVSYEGKKWIACSDATAGGKPGHGVWPDAWNSWVEYNGSTSVCK